MLESIEISEATFAETPCGFVDLFNSLKELYIPTMLILRNPSLENTPCNFFQSFFNVNGNRLIFLYTMLN